MELSPPGFRTFVVGVSYQLGNLVSSASSTIEARLGENFPLPPLGKTKRYDYGKVICIFMACVFVYVFILTFIGPERKNRDLDEVEETQLARGVRVENDSDGDNYEKTGARHTDVEDGRTYK